MEIHIHIHHHHDPVLDKLSQKIDFLTEKTKIILMTQAEELQLLRDLKAQNEKAKAEILAKIQALEDAIANGGATTPEIDAALADLKTSIQSTDDIVPDATA
jgi:hypothetical protein